MTRLLIVEIEEALGPGVEFAREQGSGLVGRRSRAGGAFLGFDRGGLIDSDDGAGRLVPMVVAVPASTFRGARLEVQVAGGWRTDAGVVLLGQLPGGPLAVEGIARVVGRVSDGALPLDRAEAEAEAMRAYQRHRERRSHARIVGGRAWLALDAARPEVARFGTPHSAAECSLRRLPPRFVRGLEGLLDDDERILYWIERPALVDPSLGQRMRGADRRAALLALTDRQLLWIVDHAQPNRELLDWGVDVELVPVERIATVEVGEDDGATLRIETVAGAREYRLPLELTHELRVMGDLLRRFTPDGASRLPARRYELEARPFNPEAGSRFGQGPVAQELHERAAADGEVLAFLFSPRRPGQREAAALVLRPERLEVLRPASARSSGSVELGAIVAIRETLSPLIGRISTAEGAEGRPGISIATPAPLMDAGAALVRLVRRALANRP